MTTPAGFFEHCSIVCHFPRVKIARPSQKITIWSMALHRRPFDICSQMIYSHYSYCNFAVISTKFECPTIQGSRVQDHCLHECPGRALSAQSLCDFTTGSFSSPGGVVAEKCRLVRARNDSKIKNSTFNHSNRMMWNAVRVITITSHTSWSDNHLITYL